MMAWAGPAFNEFLTRQAINILNSYLTTSAVSPLRKDIVEIDDPYATDLWFEVLDQTTCVPYLTLSGVPAAKLEEAGPKVKAILRDVIESGIDMQQLQSVLQRERRKVSFRIMLRHWKIVLIAQRTRAASRHHRERRCRIAGYHPTL